MKELIEKYLGHEAFSKKDEHYFYCPQCHWKNPRLVVNYSINKFHCWKCDWGGGSLVAILYHFHAPKDEIYALKKELGELNKKDFNYNRVQLKDSVSSILMNNDEISHYQHIEIDKSYKLLTKELKKKIVYRDAFNYLYGRGLSDYEINYYRIHYNIEENAILIPSYSVNDELNYYVKRYLDEKKYIKYDNVKDIKKSDIIFFESYINFYQEIILTEGVFDAIKIGYNAIPLLGVTLSKPLIQKILEYRTPVTLYFDRDAFKVVKKNSKILSKEGIKIKYIYDKNNKDAGCTSKNEILENYSNRINLDFKNRVKLILK